jgi:NadR type nicotinamide-nucleotide adenylyltransferase
LRRIVVTGSESTGKTTLARQLAEHLGVTWVAEYSRQYADDVGRPLTVADVEPIAHGQIAAEDDAAAVAAAAGNHLLILDTDLLSTLVYAEHYYGARPAWLPATARARRASLYLLCHPDVPWVSDGIRDQPTARQEIHQRFLVTLGDLGAPTVDLRGDWDERWQIAQHALARLVGG